MRVGLAETAEGLLSQEAYAIYRQCMFRPTFEVYKKKMTALINNSDVSVFACLSDQEIIGLIAFKRTTRGCAELMGIAVRKDLQGRGIGRFMLHEAARQLDVNRIAAETDGDAVGFYQQTGFEIQKIIRNYPDGEAVRYQCDLRL